jgi:hypothetical protein
MARDMRARTTQIMEKPIWQAQRGSLTALP